MSLGPFSVRQLSRSLVVILALTTAGCSSYRMIPASVDLGSAGTLGLISFRTPEATELGEQASVDFMSAMQSAQPGTPVVELGDRVLDLNDRDRGPLSRETMRTLRREFGVDAIVIGDLRITEPKPSLSIGGSLKSMKLKSSLLGTLNVRIVQTKSGATVWSNRVRAEQPVVRAAVSPRGIYTGGVQDREIAEARLIDALVHHATSDFRPRRVKQ